MSEGEQEIVVTAPRLSDQSSGSGPSFALVSVLNPVTPTAPTDPFAGMGGEAMVRVGKLNLKAKSFTIDGYSFKLKISEADWNRMSEEQKGAALKVITEFTQSPEFKQLFDYFGAEGIRNIVLHFDGDKYDANGSRIGSFPTDRFESKNDYGFVSYGIEKDGVDTNLAAGTDIHISLNPRANQSSSTFAKTFMHELYHPFVPGTDDFDEDAVDAKARKSFDEIFKRKISGTLESDEIGYALSETVIGSVNPDTIVGSTGHDTLSGREGADTINGGDGNDHVIGGAGMDILTTGSGNDFISGGTDADRINVSSTNTHAIIREEGGVDTIDTGGMSYQQAYFERIGNSLFITQDGRTIAVNGQWSTAGDRVEKFVFTDGTYASSTIEARADPGSGSICYVNGRPTICTGGFGTPVALDLDGDGIQLIDRDASRVRLDVDGDGEVERLGWVNGDDGFLALDRNANGRVDGFNEISFIEDFLGAGSDLEGLFAYDSNGDGFLSSEDERFSEFLVWRDKNGNGKSSSSELYTLEELGIARINLEKLTISRFDHGVEDNQLLATTEFYRTDGSKGMVGDLALYAGKCGCASQNLAMMPTFQFGDQLRMELPTIV